MRREGPQGMDMHPPIYPREQAGAHTAGKESDIWCQLSVQRQA